MKREACNMTSKTDEALNARLLVQLNAIVKLSHEHPDVASAVVEADSVMPAHKSVLLRDSWQLEDYVSFVPVLARELDPIRTNGASSARDIAKDMQEILAAGA